MTSTDVTAGLRYERTLRTVMWLDAFLSVALTLVCAVATPVIATVGVPRGLLVTITVVGVVSAVLLAGFGAITAVVIMLRLQAGQLFLPAGLRLPLPAGMRPELGAVEPQAEYCSLPR